MELRQEQSDTLSDAELEYWLHLPFWSPEIGIAILLGKDPRRLSWNVLKHLEGVNELADEFSQAYSRFSRDYEAGLVPSFSPPEVFVAWATDAGFDLPQFLRGFAQRTATLRRYLCQLDSRIAESEHRAEAAGNLDEAQSRTPSDEEITREAETHVSSNLADTERSSRPVEAHLSTKERATAFKIILAMAVKGYCYDPAAHRNSATSDITNDVHSIGLTIDEDTVRKYLRDAGEMHWSSGRETDRR
jgi:hypothetical protein